MAQSFIGDAFRFFGRFAGFSGYSRNNNYYTMQGVGDTTPTLINTNDKWHVYDSIPELKAIIDRKAKMISSANVKVCDKYGNVIEPNGHWIFKLIDRPTPMLSWGNMMFMTSINYSVTGNALIYAPKQTFGTRNLLVPIAFNNVQIQANKKGLKQMERSGVIDSFIVPIDNVGTTETYKTDEVIYLFEPDGINLYNAKSKIDTLAYPLSNLQKQYEKRNVLLKNMFSLGILTADVGDGITSQAIDGDDVEQTRKDIKARHKDEIIITDKNFKWQPMSFPTKDLMLFEEMTADKVALIDAFGLNQNMFGDALGKGSTYSNVEGGEKQAYNSTIIPEAEFIMDEITVQLRLDAEGYYLKPDFSHISVLQQDDQHKAQSEKFHVDKLSVMLRDGVISVDEYRTMAGI
jgi:hypothetical protein